MGFAHRYPAPDLETREAILRKKAESEKIPVPDEVTSFIAKVIPSNIRELEGSLIRVVAYRVAHQAPITVDLAAEALKSAVAQAPIHRITISKIKETRRQRARAHRQGDGQRAARSAARGAAPNRHVHRDGTDRTIRLPQIARDFGKKDHTTVMYARDKVKDQMQRDEAYRNKVRQLIAMCQNP